MLLLEMSGTKKIKRPLKINYIKSLIADDINPKYVIGKCFLLNQVQQIMKNVLIYQMNI